MDSLDVNVRAQELVWQFQSEYSAITKGIQMHYLTKELTVFSMPITRNLCAAGGFVNGFELGVVANYAGVYLAMMNSRYFTPLRTINEMKYFKPTVLGKDKEVQAYAKIFSMDERYIIVEVEIKNKDELKAKGYLKYKVLSGEYKV